MSSHDAVDEVKSHPFSESDEGGRAAEWGSEVRHI